MNFTCLIIMLGTIAGFGATNTNGILKQPPLFPSVRTYCYLPGYINYPPSSADSILARWWTNHFDFIIQGDPNSARVMTAFSPKITQVTYGIITVQTAYNKKTDVNSLEMDTLKNWVNTHYASYGYSSPDSAFESCFMHANQQVINTYSMGGVDTVPTYNPANPKASRAPSTWQQNSDYCMNLKSPVYRAFILNYFVPQGANGYDGYMFDVYSYPSEQMFVAYSDTNKPTKVREFVSSGDYQRTLASFTNELQTAMGAMVPKKLLGMNSSSYQAGATDTFQFVHCFNFILREMDCAFCGAYDGAVGSVIKATVTAGNSGTSILFQHNQSMDKRFDTGMDSAGILARDRMAGLCAYLMAKSDYSYFFSYPGQWYGYDKRITSWFNAMAYDIGQPNGQYYTFATGNDPSSTTPYIVLARKYGKALVLFKPKYAWNDTIYDRRSATTHSLGASYRPLNVDGALGSPISSISLKNWDGAILIPYSATISKGSTLDDLANKSRIYLVSSAEKDPVIRMTIQNMAFLKIEIYDAAGKLVDSQSLNAPAPNGKSTSGNGYYDYTWKKASAAGTYNAVVHVTTADGKNIKKQCRFSIVR